MAIDLDNPVVIASELNEAEACLIVNYLSNHDVSAQMWGERNTAVWADGVNMIQVVARRADRERALELLAEYRRGPVEIDWDAVDVGQPE